MPKVWELIIEEDWPQKVKFKAAAADDALSVTPSCRVLSEYAL